jgi:ActR/RegA family two-component response regulator/quercetin dioxygenase-like cupin family protein
LDIRDGGNYNKGNFSRGEKKMVFDKANILVVDDDRDLSEFIVELLVKDGYKVSSVTNVNDALYKLKNDIYDIALLDLKLPGLNGTQGIDEIKKVSPHSKVIILTGYPSVESAVSTMKSGAIDYLRKPFQNEELLEVVRNNTSPELKDNILSKLGEKIKAIRKGKGIKIKQLSTRSGLTESSISMIENAKISPSMTTIHKIAMALGVHPVEFFEIEKHKKWIISRRGERERIQFNGLESALEYLVKNGRESKNEIFLSYLGPNQKSFDEHVTHGGYNFGYVLTGSVEVELGNEKIRLNEGDTIFFEAIIPHLWRSVENRESNSLWVITRE